MRTSDFRGGSTARAFKNGTLAAIAVGAACVFATGAASAGCADAWTPPAGSAPLLRDAAPPAALPDMVPAVYRGGDGAFVPVFDDHGYNEPSIVGTWRFSEISDGSAYPTPIPNGATLDYGIHQWHSDGNEMFISGARPPSSGNVCMGVWKQIGPRTYTIKHLALVWVSPDSTPPATSAAYVGPAIIRETVTLNRAGDRYEGTITIDQYAKDEATLIEHIGGTVVAARFTFD